MAYRMRPDGLADVSLPDGSVMPMSLSPEQLEQMGHSPMAPEPPPNPASALGPMAVAGHGAPGPAPGLPGQQQPDDMAAIRDVAGNGQLSPDQFRAALSKAPAGTHEDRPIPRAEDKFKTSGADERAPVELAQHAQPKASPSGGGSSQITPEDELVYRQAIGGGGGPVREQQYLKDRKLKYSEPGEVDPALSADIARRQSDLDEQQQSNLSESHYQQSQAIQAQRAALEQQQRDLEQQRQDRMRVNDRIQELSRVRDQREQEAAAIKAPEMSDYWKDKGVMGSIATALSIALGGYLQGMRGGANPGLEMANQAIDRWIAERKEEFERAKGRVSDATNQYKEALNLYGTPEAAELDMRTRAYAVRDAMLQNQINQIGTEDAFAKGSELLQQGQLERKQLAAQAMQHFGEKAVEDTIATRLTGGGGVSTHLKGLRAVAEERKLNQEIGGTTLEERKFAAQQPAGAKQVAATRNVADLAESMARKVESLSDRASPKSREELAADAAELKVQIATMYGIPIRGAGELLDQMVGDPTQLTQLAAGARLKRLAASARHRQNELGAGGGGANEPTSAEPVEE